MLAQNYSHRQIFAAYEVHSHVAPYRLAPCNIYQMKPGTQDHYLQIPQVLEPVLTASTQLLVVVPQSRSDEETATLAAILKACGLAVSAGAELLPVDLPVSVGNWLVTGPPLHVVSFGVSPERLGLRHQVGQYVWLSLGVQRWCFAERLQVIAQDAARKRRLWECLKTLAAA